MGEQESQPEPAVFGCLDPTADIEISARNLPHWFQPGAATFITFRAADSLPRKVVLRWRAELEAWLRQNGFSPRLAEFVTSRQLGQAEPLYAALPSDRRTEFKRLSDRIWHRSLDECHGKCLLKDPELAVIVRDALLHYEGGKYDTDCFIVMPNHIHAIAQFHPEANLQVVSQSWMRYTARQINARTGGSGPFWQPEPFDHIIRSSEQFAYLQRYVAQNPAKAKLRRGESLYWERHE